MPESIRWREWPNDVSLFAAVAAVVHHYWYICPDGVTDHGIEDMTGSKPSYYKQAKDVIANCGIAEIFEAFRGLQKMILEVSREVRRKNNLLEE
jgi:hypothetical protein